MPVSDLTEVAPQSGVAFALACGEAVEIVAPLGMQVADLAFFNRRDTREYFSSGRTLDFSGQVRISTGALLYSNRSNALAVIEKDDVGTHDYLLTPCSAAMFELLRGERNHPSCLENLVRALEEYEIGPDDIHCTFNAFMNVAVLPDGSTRILPPPPLPGQGLVIRARMDLLVGLTACSSEQSNGGVCKPIAFRTF